MYKDNLVNEACQNDLDIIKEYTESDKLEEPFFPLMTYDMVQLGYPLPDHGEMVARPWHGTNENGQLIHGNGMWCKTEDIKEYLKKHGIGDDLPW